MSDPHLLDKCCLVGETVVGDPTHFMIQRGLEELGVDWRFMSFHVAAERLAEAIVGADALGFRGVGLLGGHRGRLVDADLTYAEGPLELTTRARRTSRVTHLTRHGGALQGDDASGPALVEALEPLGPVAGQRVTLLGADGAAPAVADALVEQGVASLAVADFSPDLAWRLAQRLQERVADLTPVSAGDAPAGDISPEPATEVEITTTRWESGWLELPEGCDWIISTACWPKEENGRAVDSLWPELQERHIVVDLAIGSNRSPVLLAAEERGATTLDGLPVLVGETALAIEAWTGAAIDRVVLRDAAEEFLGI